MVKLFILASKVQIKYGKTIYSAICVYVSFTNKSVNILTEFPIISGRKNPFLQ